MYWRIKALLQSTFYILLHDLHIFLITLCPKCFPIIHAQFQFPSFCFISMKSKELRLLHQTADEWILIDTEPRQKKAYFHMTCILNNQKAVYDRIYNLISEKQQSILNKWLPTNLNQDLINLMVLSGKKRNSNLKLTLGPVPN